MKPKSLALLLWLVSLGSAVFAADQEILYPYARIAMPELQIGIGTRIPAMGGAAAATVANLDSLYWNPAGLSRISGMQMELAHNSWIQGVNQETLIWGMPMNKDLNLAAGFNYFSLGSFEKTGIDDQGWMTNPNQSLNLNMLGGALGASFSLEEGLALGFSAQGFSENLGETQQLAIFGNAGLQIRGLDRLVLGITLEKLGAAVKKSPLPMTLRLGGAYELPLAEAHILLAALDAEMLIVSLAGSQTHLGLEYQYDRFLFLRLGYQISGNPQANGLNGLSIGLGIAAGLWEFGYTYGLQGDLGTSNRISVGIDLEKMFQPEKSKGSKGKKAKKPKLPPMMTPISSVPGSGALAGGLSQDEAAMRSLIKSGMQVRAKIIEPSEETQGRAEIHFWIKRDAGARIKLWQLKLKDAKGKLLRTLQEEELPQVIIWDGLDEQGKEVITLEDVRFEIVLKDVNAHEEKFQGSMRQMLEQPPIDAVSNSAATDQAAEENEEDADSEEGAAPLRPMSYGPILFDRDRAEIRPEASQVIGLAAEFIRSHPNTKVYIEGFCDGIEEADKKQMLSKARAEAVSRYLTAYHKIPLSRILLRGRGDEKPVADNLDPDARYKNRRVMIVVLERKRIKVME